MIKLIDILFEALDNDKLFFSVKEQLDHLGYKGGRQSKHGKHLRYIIQGDNDKIKSTLSGIMEILGIKEKDYSLDIIAPNEYAKGGKSGSYYTYSITLNKDSGDYKKGQQVYIVNALKEKSSIAPKSLAPTNLGLVGKKFSGTPLLVKSVKSSLPQQNNEFLSLLVDDIAKKSKKEKGDSIENFKENIELSDETVKSSNLLSITDIQSIGNDFGEILGAILLSNKINSPEVEFPSGNNPLIDFVINGYKVSSKNKSGAAATLTDIIKNIDQKSLKTKNQKELFKIFNIVVENKTSASWLEVAKAMNLPAIQTLSEITKTPIESLSIQSINDYITKVGKEKALANFQVLYKEMGNFPGSGAAKGTVDWDKINPKKYYGMVIGPMSSYVKNQLNKNPVYLKTLKEFMSKIEVKQLYLNMNLGKKTISFNLKSFSDPESNFTFEAPNQSTYAPDSGKLGFKLR
jgi:hypothetical protein